MAQETGYGRSQICISGILYWNSICLILWIFWGININAVYDLKKINNDPLSKYRTIMDEAVNQIVQSIREKWFSLSNVLYL